MNEKTIKDIGSFLTRFGPYLCLVAAVAAVMVFLPGDDESDTVAAGDEFGEFEPDDDSSSGTDGFSAGSSDSGQSSSSDSNGSQTATTAPSSGSTSSGGTSSGGTTSGGTSEGESAASPSSDGGSATEPATTEPSGDPSTADGMVANCDPNTGRIKTPSVYAPICVPAFDGDNGGASYRGVSEDTIKLAIFLVEGDASSEAVLTAAGANDDEEDVRQQYLDYVEYYTTHYEQYGREIDVTFYNQSGEASDDAAGRADAVRIAEDGNFAALNSPNNAYVDELVARGVMCMCTTSLPGSFYRDRAPFVWSTLMASTQGYVHRAEFIGKRLAGRNAEHAGDPTMALEERVFGLAYYDDDQQSYRPGVDFFIKELRQKYGVELAATVGYKGYPDVAASQEAARPLIQKMISEGVTSLACACDPFAPIFFTQEATRQNYNPEWIITGSALTDTAIFARTYDQTQWQNAFGISFLTLGLPEELDDDYSKLMWHFGEEPAASNQYGIIDSPTKIFFMGVHLAGERLDPGTFRDGMFRAPPRAADMTVWEQSSHGTDLWDHPDYQSFDNITAIWWDPEAYGEDETGAEAFGLYRYVDKGKRYLPGEQPNANTKAFQLENTIAGQAEDYPEGEAPPDYGERYEGNQ